MQKKLIKIGEISLPTKVGDFTMLVFQNKKNGKFASALVLGQVLGVSDVLVRVHSSCLTGDVFGSLLCDCGMQLEQALKMIFKEGRGVLIYLDQEGRGIGLGNKIKAMELQQKGLDTVDANLALGLPVDARTFEEAAEILQEIQVKSVKLLTNNPQKVKELQGFGVKITQRVSVITQTPTITLKYLKTKKERMGHLLSL
ncbi:MAG: GTP cyclohydrolase II [bacterium]|nr:GTP cyclohydrolase II [bacterium]